MKQPAFSVAASVMTAAALALVACKRPEEPAKPITDPARNASETSGTSSQLPTRTATDKPASPSSLIENNPTAAGGPPPAPNAADETFLKSAAQDGLFEVEVARLAADHASDSAVKSYAAMLADQRGAANERLRQVAATAGVELPSAVTPDKRQVLDKLSRASGPEFDRQFVQVAGVGDHRDAIDLFEKASKQAKHPEVRDFASSMLPTLKAQLDAAQKLPKSKG